MVLLVQAKHEWLKLRRQLPRNSGPIPGNAPIPFRCRNGTMWYRTLPTQPPVIRWAVAIIQAPDDEVEPRLADPKLVSWAHGCYTSGASPLSSAAIMCSAVIDSALMQKGVGGCRNAALGHHAVMLRPHRLAL